MAKKPQHVWGLEIGQASLKAMRCHLEGDQVIADTFDYVEYPKILTQPEAEPELLVADALEQFVSRNDLRGATVAVSAPGQSGLAKFFKPPPVEVKKIGDIVKYEAKQQIPFDLKDVIWDFQQMEGAQIEDGYALESEVGLFAMKREAVFRNLKPYRAKNIDIDFVQLAPMSLYNMIAYDRFAESMANDTFDPEAPPKSLVVLSIGTDASDLIVTNGFRVWHRNIPIGGNHFTRQLTKDLKLTFAKAEHLKKNALQADDPKLIFQAMRPVFNDLVTEIQRSLNFFKTVNKKGDFDSLLLLGNTAKLPGLEQFLNKNLGIDVSVIDKFPKLDGTEVIGAQAFKENLPAYGVVYGLCLQQLKKGPIRTNLLPREILIDRVIRNKKPWTVGALSVLLASMVTYHASKGQALGVVAETRWSNAESSVTSMKSTSDREIASDGKLLGSVKLLGDVGKEISSGAKRRVQTLELFKIIEGAKRLDLTDPDKSPEELPYPNRLDFHITSIDQQYVPDLTVWFTSDVKAKYSDGVKIRRKFYDPKNLDKPVPEISELTGSGWVFEIKGYHYHNEYEGGPMLRGEEGQDHVWRYMIEYLDNGEIKMPVSDLTGIAPKEGFKKASEGHIAIRDFGIRVPIVKSVKPPDKLYREPNPKFQELLAVWMQEQIKKGASGDGAGPGGGMGGPGGGMGGPGGGMGGPGGGMGGPGGGMGGPGGGMGGPGGGMGGPGGGMGGMGMAGLKIPKTLPDKDGKEVPQDYPAPLCEFVVQFAWKPRFEAEGGSLAGGLPAVSADGETSEDPNASTGVKVDSGANSGPTKPYESSE